MNKKNTIAKINIEMIEKNKEDHACNLQVMGAGGDLVQLFGDIAEHLMSECGAPKKLLHDIIEAAEKKEEPCNSDKEEPEEEGDEIPEEVKAGLAFLHMLGIL